MTGSPLSKSPATGPVLIGIDAGTTTIKAIAFAPEGSVLAQAAAPTPTHHPRPGWAYHHPEELWQTVVGLLRDLTARLAAPHRIASVAIASVGEAAVPLDAHGRPTYEMIAWFDTRTVAQAEWLGRVVGGRRIFEVSGLALQPIFGLCKLLWLRDQAPDAYARTARWLNTADYLAYRLCGVQATDFSLASRTLALDVRRRCWAGDLLAEIGIPPHLFAPLQASGTPLGPVLPEVAAATGLPPQTRVAVGGHDHVCGALALGVVEPGTALNSLGTAEAVFLPIIAPLDDPRLAEQGYAQGLHVDGEHAYALGGLYTSGACVDWFRAACAPAVDYATLISEAEAIPPGSVGVCFLPHLRLANPPYLDAKGRGAFVGLSADVTRGALFRAVLEGMACEVRHTLEPLLGFTSTPLRRIVATGGGARNTLLIRIKAAVLNQPLYVSHVQEATALGAALLGGLGAGVYTGVDNALAAVRQPETAVTPDPEWAAFYARLYAEVYRHLYTTLRPLHHALAPFREGE
ncbi:MAG TPA: FGGY family carbohydrate kinase [Caldilineaceae bacterium]|nr:FGGY family carbohydrate kinase [Caldilineaceae bacterium]